MTKPDLLAAFRPLYAAAKRLDERGPGPRRLAALCDALLHVEANVPEVWGWDEWKKAPGPVKGYGARGESGGGR